jgi:hypothetical protein
MALIDPEVDDLLRSAAIALAPYLPDLVIIGACANALYRYHPLASSVSIFPVGTRDVDVAWSSEVSPAGRPLLLDLLRSANLRPEHVGSQNPPVMKFRPAGGTSNVELEFLCPLHGSLTGRRRSARHAMDVQAGVTAQPLRYLDVLLIEPWQIEWNRIPDFAGHGLI